MSPQKHRRTFISYSRINKEFALKLALELRSSGFDIWLDQLDIPTGSRWDDEVEQALEDCEIFMVILTPASSTSSNVKDEIGYAIDTGKRILPILLEDAKVPLRLRRFQYVDFTEKNYDEGVESAKKLLRKLIDEPTGPVEQFPGVLQAQKDKNDPLQEEKEDDSVSAPDAVHFSTASDKVQVAYPQLKSEKTVQPLNATSTAVLAQPVKKINLSKPMMIGVGIGAVSIFAVFAFAVLSLIGRPDPTAVEPAAESGMGLVPVSGDSACPAESSQPVDINVENFTALSFDYYWIDFDCQLQYYGTLDAYNSMTLSTYVSHVWEFHENQTGDLFFGYIADGGDYLALSGELSASGVTGSTVGYVYHGDGEFVQTGDNEWIERSLTNGDEIYFEEVERDEWSVYLYDPSRDVSIQLDLWTREIIFDDNTGQEPFVLYSIIAAE
jgi:hypothetical protein